MRLPHAPRRTPPPLPTGVLMADRRPFRRTTPIAAVSYESLQPVRKALIRKMQQTTHPRPALKLCAPGSRKLTRPKWG